jgi:hypothetical protein
MVILHRVMWPVYQRVTVWPWNSAIFEKLIFQARWLAGSMLIYQRVHARISCSKLVQSVQRCNAWRTKLADVVSAGLMVILGSTCARQSVLAKYRSITVPPNNENLETCELCGNRYLYHPGNTWNMCLFLGTIRNQFWIWVVPSRYISNIKIPRTLVEYLMYSFWGTHISYSYCDRMNKHFAFEALISSADFAIA